jgi:hypothetical protein
MLCPFNNILDHIFKNQLHVPANWLSWAESLRNYLSLSYSRLSQHFMEPKGSSQASLESSIGPCHEPENPVHNTVSYFSKIHFNIILPQLNDPKSNQKCPRFRHFA